MVEPSIEPNVIRLACGLLEDREAGEMPFQPRIAEVLAGVAVLVVEDDDLSREALELLLGLYGARVHAAASVEDAMQYLENDPPALVISDIGLPGVDGFGLIRQLRRCDAERQVWTPAIAVSGLNPLDGVDPRAAGFDDFLLKPVDVQLLLARVSALVAQSRRE